MGASARARIGKGTTTTLSSVRIDQTLRVAGVLGSLTATRLQVLEALRDAPRTAEALRLATGQTLSCTQVALDALRRHGLARLDGDVWSLDRQGMARLRDHFAGLIAAVGTVTEG